MRMTERLLLGDLTKRLAEIDGTSVDLILTDPPYNTGMTAKNGTRLSNFFDDNYSLEEYRALARTTARECYRILKADRGCYVFVNWRSLGVWLDALAAANFYATQPGAVSGGVSGNLYMADGKVDPEGEIQIVTTPDGTQRKLQVRIDKDGFQRSKLLETISPSGR